MGRQQKITATPDGAPVINSPFEEPLIQLEYSSGEATGNVIPGRRISAYFSPVPHTKKGQTEFLMSQHVPNRGIELIRGEVKKWRESGYRGASAASRRLLQWWRSKQREPRLFFCQVEAVETAIWLAEAGKNAKASKFIRQESADYNGDDFYRTALKIATGGGKTAVMGMLIAWQTINRAETPHGNYCANFLVVAPGITVRDRLAVLNPSAPDNVYKAMSLLPPANRNSIFQAKVNIVNFHAFQMRERVGGAVAALSGQNKTGASTESPEEMAARILPGLPPKSPLIVFNDEGHHCYRRKAGTDAAPEEDIDKEEASQNAKDAGVWFEGLRSLSRRYNLKNVYDLSATPFFLSGSGHPPGKLFPWTASDFSLVDAIEAGIVKIPRVPIANISSAGGDDSNGEHVAPKHIWPHVKEEFRRILKTQNDPHAELKLPVQLERTLRGLYERYEKTHEEWQSVQIAPPVMIVVCANTEVSNMIFRRIAGLKGFGGSEVDPRGSPTPLFSNFDQNGNPLNYPATILVDSRALESGGGLPQNFQKVASAEIKEFRAEIARRKGAAADKPIGDADILREAVNTVGKPGRLGGGVKCVVSVAMLSEGWDATNVTHILGIRAFGSQLLCEQVVGRGLRRRNYDNIRARQVVCGQKAKTVRTFEPETVEVWGIPFVGVPTGEVNGPPPPPPPRTHVHALPERREARGISRIPLASGYHPIKPPAKIDEQFTPQTRLMLDGADIRGVETARLGGETVEVEMEQLRQRRHEQIAYALAADVLTKFAKEQRGGEQQDGVIDHRVFPDTLKVARKWLRSQLDMENGAFPQMVVLDKYYGEAVKKIMGSISRQNPGEMSRRLRLKGWLRTDDVSFMSSRKVPDALWPTPDGGRCHISHVAADLGWELQAAQTFETIPGLRCYVKNDIQLGFQILYRDGADNLRVYYPDFIVCAPMNENDAPAGEMGRQDRPELRLIVEITGVRRPEKFFKANEAEKWCAAATRDFRIKDQWDFIEVRDIKALRALVLIRLKDMRENRR